MGTMQRNRRLALATVLMAALAAPAGATTLIRAGLEDLVRAHSKIVVGEVLDTESYWNHDGTFILTDVRFSVEQAVRGSVEENSEITITLLGGEVGDLATIIVGGAELVPGNFYLLFLDEADLTGAKNALTVREHVQGAFDVRATADGLRAFSQAVRHPLLPDGRRQTEPPGGTEGLRLDSMIRSIHAIAAGREVK